MTTTNLPVFGATDDMLMAIFKRFFEGQDVHIGTLFTDSLRPPAIIARRNKSSGTVSMETKDERFLQTALVNVSTITVGTDADEIGDELQEACRIALRTAQQEQWVIPDGGSIAVITNSSPAARVSDWATSNSTVQFASLPKGWVRMESIYRMLIRPPAQSTITNRFITPAQ